MKTRLVLLLIFVLTQMTACRKDRNDNPQPQYGGKLKFSISYSTDVPGIFPLSEEYHTKFGDFITSITPSVFIGKFLDMRIQSWENPDTNMWSVNINIIDNNTPMDSSNRLADFSNNGDVLFVPKMDGQSEQAVIYNLFMFINLFYYQEFLLPAQYDTVQNLPFLEFGGTDLDFTKHSIGGVRSGITVKGSSNPFLAPIYDSLWSGFKGNFPRIPQYFVFGETTTAYQFTGYQGVQTIHNPIGQEGPVMRSPFYIPVELPAVPAGETKTVTGSMTFDTKKLIQIYAGADNIPYTKDDVFVYAPKYWNRIKINLQ